MPHLYFHRVASMHDGNSPNGERSHNVPLTWMLPIHTFITKTIILKLLCVAFKCDTDTNYNVVKKIFGAKKNEVSQ
jgi:hypothetical protein